MEMPQKKVLEEQVWWSDIKMYFLLKKKFGYASATKENA